MQLQKKLKDSDAIHDTEFVRSSFRKLMRSTVLVSAALVFVQAVALLILGDRAWKVCAAMMLAAPPLYYMTGQRRSFAVFLTGTLIVLGELLVYVTYMSAYMGPGAGFEYLILIAIPIVMVAGRIGLGTKWIIVVCIVLYMLFVESGAGALGVDGQFSSKAVAGFHILNIVLVALVLGVGAQKHFIVMSEYQVLLFQRASIDLLTGLYNRRGLFGVAEGNFAWARRFDSPLTVIVGDIDFFKHVNDLHGHAAGDVVLRQISATLKEMARDYDSVCRWGGEEFLIVLPDTGLADAAAIAERIRLRISGTPVTIGATQLGISMTFGVAQLNGVESLEAVIQRADNALYLGKQNGRNQVALAS